MRETRLLSGRGISTKVLGAPRSPRKGPQGQLVKAD
jgi:hypothetical protein